MPSHSIAQVDFEEYRMNASLLVSPPRHFGLLMQLKQVRLTDDPRPASSAS